ncbi:MAG: cytochrome c3 family protein [Phycisphaeraceae bacterium]
MKYIPTLTVALSFTAAAHAQLANSIGNSPHNLSAGGPGAIHAATEQQICIFCHTPHNASLTRPLWNRNIPLNAYQIYTSRSLQALPGQPTGSSKLCLSCHDGTIALGSVLSRDQPIFMVGGITTLPPGKSNLGTDLSDDHPISFRYDSALASRNTKIKDPALLPPAVHLDYNSELQCTSCHDAHNNQYGKFLVMDNSQSQLCNSCHQQGTTNIPPHDQCASCHQQHSAPSGPFLLAGVTVRDTCLQCHGGTSGGTAPNLAPDMAKTDVHDTQSDVNLPNPIPNNVACSDCHEPHTMTFAPASAPIVRGNFGKQTGVNAAGAPLTVVQYEYEVCFKCHGDSAAVQPFINRKIVQANTRLEFSSAAVSFHPVEAAGKNPNVPSLKPGFNASSIIYCSDCHSSDTGTHAGGSSPNGPHGSNQSPLLIARYDTTDQSSESSAAYALCYRCHNRNSILNDQSFKEHKKHIVEERTPCSACHDAHGIASGQGTTANNARLINFDTNIVSPTSGGVLQYQSLGVFRGTCTLKCHGEDHNNESY